MLSFNALRTPRGTRAARPTCQTAPALTPCNRHGSPSLSPRTGVTKRNYGEESYYRTSAAYFKSEFYIDSFMG